MRGVWRLTLFVGIAQLACATIVGFADLERIPPATGSPEAGLNASISLGANHSCAVMVDQTVRCWGLNSFGQLGIGSTENKTTPTPVPGLSSVVFLSLGDSHTCATIADGSVLCWGSNENGQLGLGGPPDSEPHTKPARVQGASPAKKVQAGKAHTCTETLTKTVECWGANRSGQLGDGTTTPRSAPTLVPGVTGVQKLSTGDGDYTCAVAQAADAGGFAVYCWGINDKGQLGQPASQDPGPVPRPVPGIPSPAKVYLGRGHACATLQDTTITCWGVNAHGQLGDGDFDTRSTPKVVDGVLGMSEVSPAFDHTCGSEDGTGIAKCWGSNAHGQLGVGSIGADVPQPQALDGNGWEAITTDGDHSCGRRQGVNYCWGRNDFGQLGNGTTTDNGKPSPVKF